MTHPSQLLQYVVKYVPPYIVAEHIKVGQVGEAVKSLRG